MKPITRFILRRFANMARPYLRTNGLLRTSKVFNNSVLVWNPGAERVVLLAPHMDDESIGCGGTLALHARAGAQCRVVFLTDGRHGSSQLKGLTGGDRVRAETALVATRKDEARRALETLGVQDVLFLDVEDGKLATDETVVVRVRQILEEYKPQLVYVPCFLEQHPDHYAASRILVQATANTELNFQCLAYEVWTPLFPNCMVNIDEVAEVKKQALGNYKSQLRDMDYQHSALGLNAYRSVAFSDHRSRFAEAFLAAPLTAYRAMFSEYGSGV
jgi:N-acetylglucosamine malate deacetylase 1